MTAGVSSRLYTPDILALAVSLARFPLDPGLPFHGEARSRICGSTLQIGLSLDEAERISGLGLQVRACALGQAAAAIFAAAATGRSADEIDAAAEAVERWLAGEGSQPQWRGIEALVPARGYPARHGAILLPWKAAQAALGKGAGAS
ncbi:MAG: iron-sulfur cluster assembly scaffold protein [Sphingomonadaceae bacterium]